MPKGYVHSSLEERGMSVGAVVSIEARYAGDEQQCWGGAGRPRVVSGREVDLDDVEEEL